MSKNKKPRKKYVPRVLAGGHLPLSLKTKNNLATSGMKHLNAIKYGEYNREVGMDLILYLTAFKNAIGTESPEVSMMILEMFQAINRVKDRFDRTGKWGFTGDERNMFLDYLPAVSEFMDGISRAELMSGRVEAQRRLEAVLRPRTIDNAG